MAVVDLNFLKQINDTSGHAAGDAAIMHVARALRTHFRITDPIFRVGGDEFLVILEGGRSADLTLRPTRHSVEARGWWSSVIPGLVVVHSGSRLVVVYAPPWQRKPR